MNWGFIYAISVAFIHVSFAEIRINEFMPSNTRAYPDITDFEDYPDWIELHNTSAEDRSLRGYHLSDDPEVPLKWSFPKEAMIPAGGFLVVIADGYDTYAGVELRRTSHGRPKYTTEKHHTNFSLSSAGETILLTEVVRENAVHIAMGDTWKYLDDGSDLGLSWREPDFDEGAWSSGAAPLGYGDPVSTVLSFGADDENRHITSYYRKSFQVVNLADFEEMTLDLVVDDGALVYLNGNLIASQNMSGGFINFLTPALLPVTQDEEELVSSYTLPEGMLLEGENVVAVEVHQINNLSQDLRFDLSLASMKIVGPELRESVSYSQQVTDVSLGRDENDPELWVNFAESTPGEMNSGPLVDDPRFESSEVDISPLGGLLDAPVSVELNTSDGEIYYSLDGSNPSPTSPNSMLYEGAIEVSETTVVRARCFSAGKVPGPIATKSYFMGESFSGLPYLSVVADPETLFGDEIGIYLNRHERNVGVGPSVYKGKDAPGHLEFFPEDGGEGFGVNGGFRIGGENNWSSHWQRALNFTTRGKYGDDGINFDLFPGSGIPTFTALTLREGGDDWGRAHLTDALFDSIVRGRLEVETNRFRPSVLFINGVYWGLYNIRDRWNDNWLFQHYGTNDGEYDRIDLGNGAIADNGSTDDYNDLIRYLDGVDLNDPNVWAVIESRIDIVSAVDFVIAEGYSRNSSWSGNREIWRDHRPGGKWRYFIPDMDRTFGNTSFSRRMGQLMSGDQIIRRIQGSAEFKKLLAQRYAAHLVTTFDESRMHGLIDYFSGLMSPELPRQRDRWGGVPSETSYPFSIQRMKNFVTARSGDVIEEIQTVLSLDPAVNLSLISQGPGSFEIEGVPIEQGTLKVFPNIGVEIKAVPAPGYRFDGWVEAEGGAKLDTVLTGESTLTAKFVSGLGSVVEGVLDSDTRYTLAGSPYIFQTELLVPIGLTLTVEEGVSMVMAQGAQLRVNGTLNIEGTEDAPVTIAGLDGEQWGGISFEETSTTSTLSHLTVRHAGRGYDPLVYPAGISGLDADVVIEFLNIDEGLAPLFFRGGSLILRDSFIHIPITGDGLNVKQGQAQTLRCVFLGNNAPDTDAIDYDGVVNGVIGDCQIYRFYGFNSDGIDIGEQCVDVLIEGNQIYYNSDKGISVGQGSTVISRNNLIVGCPLGIGVKDQGSTITVDQNTFVDCGIGVSVYEKNFGAGGSEAVITNSIFSNSSVAPVDWDSYSTVSISYSLSDTDGLPGANNLLGFPGFVEPSKLNFSLLGDSIAKDSGDPFHALDPDATVADRGAYYLFDSDHYPFLGENIIVINEVLANSGAGQVDWIEIHNRSNEMTDISGWFLSDDGGDLTKFCIPDGTMIPAGGFIVFYEDIHFGEESTDPGRLVPFSLSDTGETVYLSSGNGVILTDYRFEEKFGPSLEGQTLGYYYKPSSGTYNFIAQQDATLAQKNGAPVVGPILISEIMYHPSDENASEYIELLNISDTPVSLYDFEKAAPWRLADGVVYAFQPNVVLQPGERILVVEDLAKLGSYSFNPSIRKYQWSSGRLNDGGESVQLNRPGPSRGDGSRSYVRVDRVNYDDNFPWPLEAGGDGLALRKISEKSYGNDFINWTASEPTPGNVFGADSYALWSADRGVSGVYADPDEDGRSNLIEYALGSDPRVADAGPGFSYKNEGHEVRLGLGVSLEAPDVDLLIERSSDLETWQGVDLTPTEIVGRVQVREISLPIGERWFFRLNATLKP